MSDLVRIIGKVSLDGVGSCWRSRMGASSTESSTELNHESFCYYTELRIGRRMTLSYPIMQVSLSVFLSRFLRMSAVGCYDFTDMRVAFYLPLGVSESRGLTLFRTTSM